MSVIERIAGWKRRGIILPGGAGGAPPSSGGFLDAVNALSPAGIWPLSDASQTDFTDFAGRQGGQWVTGVPSTRRPTLVNDDANGWSIELNADVRGSIPDHNAHRSASGGVFLVFQTRNAGLKQALVNRAAGPPAGRWLLEINAAGGITASLRDAGGVKQEISTPNGVVTKGKVSAVAFTWGPAGMKLYHNSSTPSATNASVTDGAAGASAISVGAWYTGADFFTGLMGWLVLFSTQPSDADIGTLMAKRKTAVLHASDDRASVPKSTYLDIAVLANDHFQGADSAATVQVTQQGSLGTLAVQPDNTIRYTAGSMTGTDTAARYAVNGSSPAKLEVEVTPNNQWAEDSVVPLPSGYGTWQTFWSHDTGGIDQAAIDANWNKAKNGVYPWRRYAMASPDNKPAVRDRLVKGDQIEPIGYDPVFVPFDLTQYRYLLLRYHYWSTAYWGCEGKYFALCGGRGWIGSGYAKPSGSTYGTDGFGLNAMHPHQNNTTNYLRGMGSYYGQNSTYGDNLPYTGQKLLLPGAWRCIDVLIDLGTAPTAQDGAYKVFFDGVESAAKTGIRPAQVSTADCNGVWFRWRPMSGGTPANLIGQNLDGDHYYGGFFLLRSTG